MNYRAADVHLVALSGYNISIIADNLAWLLLFYFPAGQLLS